MVRGRGAAIKIYAPFPPTVAVVIFIVLHELMLHSIREKSDGCEEKFYFGNC